MAGGTAGNVTLVKTTSTEVNGVPATYYEFSEQHIVGKRPTNKAEKAEHPKPSMSLNEGLKGLSRFLPTALALLGTK
jgi:hypothetical protein